MAIGYEDIDNWRNQQSTLLQQQEAKQNEITQKQTKLNIDELNREKAKIDTDVNKTTSGMYTEYQKQANQYGAEADRQARLGLANSGYAETIQTNLYNTYQKNVTDTLNNARNLKAEFYFQISKARQTGDITLAQNALEIYNQKMQLLTQEYEMRNNREQFLYQKDQDAQAQSNWEKEYAYQQSRDQIADRQWQQTFDYQKQRDAVSDNQWQQQFNLSKKKSSSGSSNKNSNSKELVVNMSSDSSNQNVESSQQNKQTNIKEYNLDKKVESILGTTKPNSVARQNFLNGLVTFGEITKEEKEYLMGVK